MDKHALCHANGLITQNRYGSIDTIARQFTIRAIHNKTLSGKTMVYRIMKLALACVITATLGSAFAAERIKLGYLVKQPEEAWFQTEWAYAEKAGKDLGFDVIKIGVFEPLTGANGAGGADEYDGIKLANKLFPEVLGKKVELVVVDNKSDKVEAANAATVLAQKE